MKLRHIKQRAVAHMQLGNSERAFEELARLHREMVATMERDMERILRHVDFGGRYV